MLLAGDIGGTKTQLALYEPGADIHTPAITATFPSGQYGSLEAVIGDFLRETGAQVTHASFCVAGPVVAGRAKITNLPWMIEEETLAATLHLSGVRLLNDLEAIAAAVPLTTPDDLHTLNAGEAVAGGPIAVIAPGTGLGEAYLTWDGGTYRAHASEGGHADFAPNTPQQIEMLIYLMRRYGRVSYERVISGLGIPNIYDYVRGSGYAPESPALAAHLAGATDRAPIIVAAACADDADALCTEALRLFVAVLGAEAGNLALKIFATSGVYLSGGIPPRILPALSDGQFMHAFADKGRFTELLSRVPVHVIIHPIALLGAARYGTEMM